MGALGELALREIVKDLTSLCKNQQSLLENHSVRLKALEGKVYDLPDYCTIVDIIAFPYSTTIIEE